MRTLVVHSVFFVLIGLVLSPLAVAHASSPSADYVQKCALFDYEQWRRDHPRPAGKRLANLNVGEPRTVRMIYFLPNDRPYDAALVDLMKTRMRQMQALYAEQMQAYGYGNRTFRFETDAAGEPLVHRVDGQHPNSYYWVPGHQMHDLVLGEIEQTFDLEENIYFIVVDDAVVWEQVGSPIGRNGGFALISSTGSIGRVAEHELGHAFRLSHDFRDGDYIMSYGYDGEQGRLSACDARSLAVHPYFNSNAAQTEPPTIELTSSLVYTGDATTVPVRIKVRDSDGLHQVVLFVSRPTSLGVSRLSFELKECRGLEGEKEAVVEFDYDGVIPSRRGSDFDSFRTQLLMIQAIDALGNVTFSEAFELVNARESIAPIATLTGPVTGYKGQAFSVSFSPDGRLLASGSHDHLVKLWDVSSGETVTTLTHEGFILSLSFSPGGRLLASGGYRSGTVVKLWNVSTGESIATLSGSAPVSFYPKGRLLASGSGYGGQTVKLWDVSTGESIATLAGHEGQVQAVSFSPDGRLLASAASDGTIRLWNTAGWTPIPHTLTRSSGDGQQGRTGATLAEPFVVSVLDQYGSALAGAVVSFSVTAGGGALSSTTDTTDANGEVAIKLTLGSEAGTNTVSATVEGLEPVTFTATAVDQTPHSRAARRDRRGAEDAAVEMS